ncbi:restriction endonuclease subunit S [Aerococcaceae bacterium NML190938]|nr:restriction endonuclease subunit S [Aerococcaceae bacterium NML190938]
MNKIEELIQQLCPNGVEYKELGEVADIGTGSNNTNEQIENGKYPFYVRSKDVKRINTYSFDEEAIIIPGEGGIGEIFHYINGKYGLHQRAYRIHLISDDMDTLFLYHYMKSNFKKFISKHAVSATVSSIRKPMIEKFKVPIPPLEIQKEIVKILDKFTKYVTELTSELTFRKQQYSYYRDKLLSFEDSDVKVEWKTLGEIFEFKNGLNKGKEYFGRGTPIINYMDVYKNNYIVPEKVNGLVEVNENEISRFSIRKGDVFFTRTSETVDDIGKATVLLEDIKDGVFSGFILRARPKTNMLLPKYCAYCFSTSDFRKNVVRYSTYTTRALTNGGTLSNLKIPIPPLHIQEKIVEVLDNFDKVCNDLNIGLPKEIEQRQQQYEYYRDLLLTFDVNNGSLPACLPACLPA